MTDHRMTLNAGDTATVSISAADFDRVLSAERLNDAFESGYQRGMKDGRRITEVERPAPNEVLRKAAGWLDANMPPVVGNAHTAEALLRRKVVAFLREMAELGLNFDSAQRAYASTES